MRNIVLILCFWLIHCGLYGQNNYRFIYQKATDHIEDFYFDTSFNDIPFLKIRDSILGSNQFMPEKFTYNSIDNIIALLEDGNVHHVDTKYAEGFMQNKLGAKYIGIGLSGLEYVKYDNATKNYRITNVELNSPAYYKGIRAGDILTGIDGNLVEQFRTKRQLYAAFHRENGESIILSINRNGRKIQKTLSFKELDRDMSTFYHVFESKQKKIAVIWIPRFTQNTSYQVSQIINQVEKEGIDHLIIDLRNNMGGELDRMRSLLGYFIGEKPIAKTYNRESAIKMTSSLGKASYTGSVSVLVNSETAFSAELFAGSFQYYNRGKVIGEPTAQRGYIFNLYSLGDESILVFPTGELELLNGDKINQHGVTPDIVISDKRKFRLHLNYRKDKILRKTIKQIEF